MASFQRHQGPLGDEVALPQLHALIMQCNVGPDVRNEGVDNDSDSDGVLSAATLPLPGRKVSGIIEVHSDTGTEADSSLQGNPEVFEDSQWPETFEDSQSSENYQDMEGQHMEGQNRKDDNNKAGNSPSESQRKRRRI